MTTPFFRSSFLKLAWKAGVALTRLPSFFSMRQLGCSSNHPSVQPTAAPASSASIVFFVVPPAPSVSHGVHLDSPPPSQLAYASVQTVRIFLSSPGDVAAERAAVRDLLLGLARGAFVRGRVHIGS